MREAFVCILYTFCICWHLKIIKMFLCIAFVIKNSVKLGLNVQLPKFSTFRVMSFLQNGDEKNREKG